MTDNTALEQVLRDIDFELMQIEDYMHGEDGKRITAIRKKIADIAGRTASAKEEAPYPKTCDEPNCVIPDRCYHQGKPTLCGIRPAASAKEGEAPNMEAKWAYKCFELTQEIERLKDGQEAKEGEIQELKELALIYKKKYEDTFEINTNFYRKIESLEKELKEKGGQEAKVGELCPKCGYPVSVHEGQKVFEGCGLSAVSAKEGEWLCTDSMTRCKEQCSYCKEWESTGTPPDTI